MQEIFVGNVVVADQVSGDFSSWTGGAGTTDWDDSDNWCFGEIPSSTVDAYIPPDSSNSITYPVIEVTDNNPSVRSLFNYGELTVDGQELKVDIDIDNNGSLDLTNGKIVIEGAVPSEIFGDSSIVFSDLLINKDNSEDSVELSQSVIISNELDLTSGVIASSSADSLILLDDVAIVNASSASYVSGPIVKIGDDGDDVFEYPVGKSGVYAPITLESQTTIQDDDTVIVEYFNSAAPNATSLQDTLSRVSALEYWDVDFGTNADTSYTVTLHWDQTERNSGINTLDVLDIAYYDAVDSNKWILLEGTSSGDVNTVGTVVSDGGFPLAKAGPITFTTTVFGEVLNPLPVNFVRFSVELVDETPNLLWITSSEEDNAYFVIERSDDALNFDSLDYELGSGTISETALYTYADYSYEGGTYYYRIRQVDYDGTSSYSSVKSVSGNVKLESQLSEESSSIEVYPMPLESGGELTIEYSESSEEEIYSLRLLDRMGAEVMFREVNAKGIKLEKEALDNLTNGIYFLQLETSEGIKSAKLIKAK